MSFDQLATLDPADIDEPATLATPSTSCATRQVLHIVNGEHYAGAERVQDLLALQLPQFGYDVTFACVCPKVFPKTRRSNVRLIDASMTGKFDLRPAWQLAKLVREEGFELIHSHTPRSAMIGRAVSFLTGVPLVHHLHSPTSRDSTRRWSNCANMWIERASMSHARALVAVSQSLAGYAKQMKARDERVFVIPNGVPIRGPLADRPTPTTAWTIGCVALFRPRKGIEVLLDALAELIAMGHDVRLRAVGTFETPAYGEEIMRRVDQLKLANHIEWRGFQTDVDAEFRQMDLFVLPSLFGEGMPMVVLEAMANGVPVISTRVEGVPEAVRDGVDGLLADPGNAASLALAISQFIAGDVDWSDMRQAAHRRHAECFSDRSMAEKLARVYDVVLG